MHPNWIQVADGPMWLGFTSHDELLLLVYSDSWRENANHHIADLKRASLILMVYQPIGGTIHERMIPIEDITFYTIFSRDVKTQTYEALLAHRDRILATDPVVYLTELDL